MSRKFLFWICVELREKRDEGEKCTSPLECRSEICTNKKCAIKKENEACQTNKDECGKGAYCSGNDDAGVCKKLSGKDGDCTNDEQCEIGLTINALWNIH